MKGIAQLATAAVLLLAATRPLAAAPIEADPHELYEAARDHLRNGELEPAERDLSRLRGLIAHGSQWDPDGVFANQLLPPLLSRLRRMQAVTHELDAFSDRALEDLKPPEITDDVATLRRYTDWATAVIQRLRGERDHIVEAGLSDPEEQAALTRTASYARTEQLLETEVLRSTAKVAGNGAFGLLSGDARVDPLLVRFGQLKRDLMQIMVERDQLEKQLKKSRDGDEAHLRALAALVTEGAQPESPTGNSQSIAVSDRFGQFLDHQLSTARLQTSQTSEELEARRATLGRYRRYNEVLTQTGLGTDQSRRIQALTRAVEDAQVNDGLLVKSSAARWVYGLLASALALIAVFSSWLAVVRGRRLSSERRMSDPSRPVLGAKLPRRDVGGNAA